MGPPMTLPALAPRISPCLQDVDADVKRHLQESVAGGFDEERFGSRIGFGNLRRRVLGRWGRQRNGREWAGVGMPWAAPGSWAQTP